MIQVNETGCHSGLIKEVAVLTGFSYGKKCPRLREKYILAVITRWP